MLAFLCRIELLRTVKAANAFGPSQATAELIIQFEQLEDAVAISGSNIAPTSFRCPGPQPPRGDGLYRPRRAVPTGSVSSREKPDARLAVPIFAY